MVAVVTRTSTARNGRASRPSLVLIPGGQESAPVRLLPRPDCPVPASPTGFSAPMGFRVVPQPDRLIVRYWRLMAVVMIAVAVIAGGWLVVRAIGGLGGGGSLTSSDEAVTAVASAGGSTAQGAAASDAAAIETASPSSVRPAQGRAWVVRPGDTLWGIVQASGVKGDPRPVVDKLSAELKGQPLQVGQVVTVP